MKARQVHTQRAQLADLSKLGLRLNGKRGSFFGDQGTVRLIRASLWRRETMVATTIEAEEHSRGVPEPNWPGADVVSKLKLVLCRLVSATTSLYHQRDSKLPRLA